MAKGGERRLGRGLNALISSTVAEDPEGPEAAARVEMLPLERVGPNPFQPRVEIDRSDLRELAESIRQVGILQPVTVREHGDRYELVMGERRLRAARMAGLSTIPAIVREVADERMLEEALIENIQREDLNPIERGKAYRRYCDEFGLSPEGVAERVGESRANVINYMRLLELGDVARDKLATGALRMGHGRALLGLMDRHKREELAERADRRGWSVRQLEDVVRKLRGDAPRRGVRRPEGNKPVDERTAMFRDLETRLAMAVGTAVSIQQGANPDTGKVIIDYYSLDDFERIGRMLGASFE